MQSKVLVSLCSFLLISIFITSGAEASSFLDEFTSIYHSNAIIEVGVVLDETGHPKDSCYLKTIKGDKEEIKEILKTFGICEKKKIKELDQKRVMLFYRNKHGKLRSMDLIREKDGPYSDEEAYTPYIKMVKFVDRKLSKYKGDKEGMIVLDDRSTCKRLKKNKYFNLRYGSQITQDGFAVGGDAGVFKEFYPLVKIECENRS